MIIRSLEFAPYQLVFPEPFQTGSGKLFCREGFVIKVCSDRPEMIGLGESAPLDGFGMESLAETEMVLRDAQRSLINSKIENLDDITNLLTNLLTKYDLRPAAKHGLELGLLNLLAQQKGRSLSQLLADHFGGTIRAQVAVNAVIGAIAPSQAATKAKQYLDQGFDCIKIKVGTNDFDADLRRVFAVRSQVGDAIQIRIDANQGWSTTEAIANLKKLEFLQIEYVEQPVIASDLIGMAKIRRSQSIAIAADESVNNLIQLQQIIDAEAADIIILKPMALGGLITAYRAALLSFQFGLDVVVTTTMDGEIGCEAAASLAAALPIKRACGLSTGHIPK